MIIEMQIELAAEIEIVVKVCTTLKCSELNTIVIVDVCLLQYHCFSAY